MKTYKLDPYVVTFLMEDNRCWYKCKKTFDKPWLYPLEGHHYPVINGEALYHIKDTHGMPPGVWAAWLWGYCYGMDSKEALQVFDYLADWDGGSL